MGKALTQIRFEQWLQNGQPSLMRLGGNRWLKFRETADGFEYMYREGCWRTFKPVNTTKMVAKDTLGKTTSAMSPEAATGGRLPRM